MEEKKYRWMFPHVKGTMTTAGMMRMVLLALLPAAVFGTFHFGFRALLHMVVCLVTCVLTEFTFEAFTDRPLAVTDGSAAVTGMLLALLLPVGAPLWVGFLGGVFAIAVIKMPIGGLGKNRLNPALSACAVLMLAFPGYMKDYSFGTYGAKTLLGQLLQEQTVDPFSMLWGGTNGSIGAASALMLLVGALILLGAGVIRLRIPAAVTAAFTLTLFLFSGRGVDQLFFTTQILGGGFLLVTFFMATDTVTSPITPGGQILYGILIGILTGIFRLCKVEEGVIYAVLIANLVVPFLEEFTVPKAFGYRKMVRVSQKRR